MPVTDVRTDEDHLTLTVTTELPVMAEEAWTLWSDPRRLERWWGPPSHPASFGAHALEPGARSSYTMTGPDGDTHGGWWRVVEVHEPRRLVFEDGFADEHGDPNPEMPSTMVEVTLHDLAGAGTRIDIETTFASAEVMAQVLGMGLVEGMTTAVGQMDALEVRTD